MRAANVDVAQIRRGSALADVRARLAVSRRRSAHRSVRRIRIDVDRAPAAGRRAPRFAGKVQRTVAVDLALTRKQSTVQLVGRFAAAVGLLAGGDVRLARVFCQRLCYPPAARALTGLPRYALEAIAAVGVALAGQRPVRQALRLGRGAALGCPGVALLAGGTRGRGGAIAGGELVAAHALGAIRVACARPGDTGRQFYRFARGYARAVRVGGAIGLGTTAATDDAAFEAGRAVPIAHAVLLRQGAAAEASGSDQNRENCLGTHDRNGGCNEHAAARRPHLRRDRLRTLRSACAGRADWSGRANFDERSARIATRGAAQLCCFPELSSVARRDSVDQRQKAHGRDAGYQQAGMKHYRSRALVVLQLRYEVG